MKLKTGDALALSQAILMAQTSGKFAPAKFGFVLAVNAKALASIAETYDKTRIEIATQFSKKDAEGNPLMIKDGASERFDVEDMAGLNEALCSVQNSEIDVALMEITLDDFPKEFDPGLVMGLLPIIKEPEKAAA